MDSVRWDKVLVVQTSFLGDTVLTLPLFSEIKRRFPETRLAVLCGPQSGEILADQPAIDEIIIDDKKGADRGLLGMWRKARVLKEQGFTIAVSPHKSFRSALLLFLAGIPYRVGFRQSAGWFFFHSLADRVSDRHDVERNLSILNAFEIRPEDCRRNVEIEINRDAQETVKRVFRSAGVAGGGQIFGLNPGSVWPTKRWPAERYARLVELLKEKYTCEVLLFGGPEDSEIVAEIQRRSGNRAISLVGKIALHHLPAALSRCDLFITNDSGPMHIAVARGVWVVAIFCATTPSLGFYPYSRRAVVVEKDLPCRPCGSHGGRRCPLGTDDCMRLVQAEDVMRAVDRVLGQSDNAEGLNGSPYEPRFVTL
jgi:heptosyltransferase II